MANKRYFNYPQVVGFVLSLGIFCGIAFYGLVVFWPQSGAAEPTRIDVPKGASLGEVADILRESEIIDSTKPFVLAAQLMGYEKSIRAGVLLLKDVSSNFRLIQQLVENSPIVHRITVPEGLQKEQIAEIFHGKLGTEPDDFLALCVDDRLIRSFGLDVPSLEGFLTPETYFFHEGESPRTIIQTMVREYHQFLNDSLGTQAESLGLSFEEVITLASIIEGEAIYDEERPLISAVYHNRLRKGMKLQADPTIQYIIDDGPRRLLNSDLSIESPYNTYLNSGLPAGPINSPGKESILAALYPAQVNYLYFVATGEGYHTFSRTQMEHRNAKRKLRELRRTNRKSSN